MAGVTPQIDSISSADERPSKGELKRRQDRLQDLGKRLLELPAGKLARIDLPEKLLNAVLEGRRITAMGAIRRQLQYIGRIMEEFDTVAIARALRDIDFVAAPKPPKPKTPAVLAAESLIAGGDDALFAWSASKSDGQIDSSAMQNHRQALRLATKNIALGKNAAHEAQLLASKLGIRN